MPGLANISELIEDACSCGTYLLEVKQELMAIKEREDYSVAKMQKYSKMNLLKIKP